jgi:hypothetical protein
MDTVDIEITDEVFGRIRELTRGAWCLYAYWLICHGTGRRPLLRQVAADLHADYEQVCRWRKELVAKGWITLQPRGNKAALVTPLVGVQPYGFGAVQEGWVN